MWQTEPGAHKGRTAPGVPLFLHLANGGRTNTRTQSARAVETAAGYAPRPEFDPHERALHKGRGDTAAPRPKLRRDSNTARRIFTIFGTPKRPQCAFGSPRPRPLIYSRRSKGPFIPIHLDVQQTLEDPSPSLGLAAFIACPAIPTT